MKTEVFISGGGIGGLTLALKLAKRGIDVVVAEKLPGETPVYKGELLQPKSMQVFEGLGLDSEIRSFANEIRVLDLLELSSSLQVKDRSFMDYSVLPGKFNRAFMIRHEQLKSIIRNAALQYPHFHYFSGTACKELTESKAVLQLGKDKTEVEARYFFGAEGRASVTRKAMGISVKAAEYNHHFLTVTFPRRPDFTDGRIISTYNRFLGLFPLPDNEVRSVYLISPGEYKQLKEKPVEYFHKMYTDLAPSVNGYVQQITSWKKIQLMIPIQYHASSYVKGNKAIIGDAAHAVHPMAGEGMNMAIQDADILGELAADMITSGHTDPENLHWYEKVRYSRAAYVLGLSHLSALAYSFPYKPVSYLRRRTFERMEEDQFLHYKQMLNISGMGIWKENARDRLIQSGVLPRRKRGPTLDMKERNLFAKEDDYPWKEEGLT
ncbi:FAD-dependent oxidoreductase [Planococcus lenghuensis]|uniref:FAD-dependent oxidoreductase n=1 Tax=Planococcus lenghuensis TaxID=2213202 RepID=A0A1Q2KWJ1_9BACL|nr:NAD(P)/FAD-dependent oxidoreductase [Planococcus lenghuensis]AQQ52484.1 FAD-dependent oxidoreductase [Planococcus lenghuensis]